MEITHRHLSITGASLSVGSVLAPSLSRKSAWKSDRGDVFSCVMYVWSTIYGNQQINSLAFDQSARPFDLGSGRPADGSRHLLRDTESAVGV